MAKYTRKQAECAIRFWQKALNEAVAAESEEDQEKERQAEEEKAKAEAAAKEEEAKAAEEKTAEAKAAEAKAAEEEPDVDVEAGFEFDEEKDDDEKVEESAPGSAKYPANTVGAVCELLKKSDPFDRLFIRLVPGKEECMVVDIDRKITMKSGVTYMDVAKGSPLP